MRGGDIGQHVAEILHLVVAGVAGDEADDLQRRARQAELGGEQLDIAGERLRPWRRLGGLAQIRNQLLAIAAVDPVEIGIGEAAGIEAAQQDRELVGNREVHQLAALIDPVEDGEQPAQRQIAALEDAGEIARDEAPLDIGGDRGFRVGVVLASEQPHRPIRLDLSGRPI